MEIAALLKNAGEIDNAYRCFIISKNFSYDINKTKIFFISPDEIDVNFINATNDFNLNERCTSNHSMHDTNQTNNSCVIIDLSPEWSYCEVCSCTYQFFPVFKYENLNIFSNAYLSHFSIRRVVQNY